MVMGKELTAKQRAYAIACYWLRMAYEKKTGDVWGLNATPAYHTRLHKELGLLHNQLARKGGLHLDKLED
jgi:hypothetical protein